MHRPLRSSTSPRLDTYTPPAFVPDESCVPPPRPGDAPGEPESNPPDVVRWGIALLVIVAGAALTAGAVTLAGAGGPWASVRTALRPEGYVVVALSLTWLLLGALLHTPSAIRRGARVRQGWLTAYTMVVALIAVPPAPPLELGGTRYGPGPMYGILLFFVLLPPALLAAAGGLFMVLDDPDDLTDSAGFVIGVVPSVGWAVGGVLAALILSLDPARFGTLPLPAGGLPVVAVGLALSVPSVAAAACYGRHRPGTTVPRALLLSAAAVLLGTLSAAQLTRVVPGGAVLAFAIVLVPPAFPWLVQRLRDHLGRNAAR
ncbi:hypothetical protein [Actinoplanes sp. G11-F43]|uniref:hypothetical protein n=1 Tax=Actinoplanes sp. G11-F43 TaxID=3424130 RepID=UPI003D3369DB